MMKKIKIYIMLVLALVSFKIQAQQDAQFTHYMFNPTSINPAFSGYRETLSVVGIHRSQWFSIDGAPTSQSISIHSPLNREELGLGFNVVNDKIGPSNEIYANVDLSYSIMLRDYKKLSFGIKGGAHMLNVDYTKLHIQNPNDYELGNNIENKILPQVGVGVLYQAKEFYLGLAVPDLIETKHLTDYVDSSKFEAKKRMNLYLSGGYYFDVNENLQIQPATQIKMVNGSPLQIDLSSLFLINDRFTVGASYRVSASFSGLVSFKLMDNLLLGVSYDYDTNDLQNYSSGSYEFMLRYELFKRNLNKIVNPRFF